MNLSRLSVVTLSMFTILGGVASVWTWEAVHAASPDLPSLSSNPVPDMTCSVAPLAPVSDASARAFEAGEGLAVDVSGLTPKTLQAMTRLENKVLSMGGQFKLTSAFRPASYQQHLRDVWFKWMDELRENQQPGCAELRAEVQGEFQRHGLLETQHPVEVSDHTMGTGFDAAITLPLTVVKAKRGKKKTVTVGLDQIARLCGLRRPNPLGDRVHYRCAS